MMHLEAEIASLEKMVASRDAEIKAMRKFHRQENEQCTAQLREQVAKLQATIERVRAIVFVSYSALPGITIGEIRKALSESEIS